MQRALQSLLPLEGAVSLPAGACKSQPDAAGNSEMSLLLLVRSNRLGLACFQAGIYAEAFQHFLGALYYLSCEMPTDIVSLKSSSLEAERPSKRRRTDDGVSQSTTPSTSMASTRNSPNSEYDEGMSCFAQCFSLDASKDDRRRMKSVILLNIALTHVALLNFDGASACFDHALKASLPDLPQPQLTNSTSSVRLVCFHGLGNICFKRGEVEEAAKYFRSALEICENDEVDQGELAAILNALGVLNFHRARCDVEAAKALFERALSIQQDFLGSQHTTVATTLNNLGRVLCIAGRFDEALTAYNEAFEIRAAVLGMNHLDTAATAYNIGQTYHQKKDLQRALRYYDHFMLVASRQLGQMHQDVALTLKCIAQIYQEYRRFDEALAIYKFALSAAVDSLGHHAEVASILNKIGNIQYEKGSLSNAQEAYEKGLEVEREVLEENHPNIAVTLSNLGHIFHKNGDLKGALKLYKEALQVQLSFFKKANVRMASTWASIGHIQLQMRKFSGALESYQEALRIRRSFIEGDGLEMASLLNSVGLVLFKLGVFELALDSFAKCLRIRSKILGRDDRDVAVPLYNIATIHQEMGSDDEALRFFEEVLRIERVGKDEDLASTLSTLARLYDGRGDCQKALACYEEILSGLQKDLPKDEPNVVRSLMAIANIHLRRGETAALMERATEAIRVRQRHGKRYDDLRLSGLFLFSMSKLCPVAASVA
jgi:tetratricopeptide (TPR) repeat protein